jgi:hypothetical protein
MMSLVGTRPFTVSLASTVPSIVHILPSGSDWLSLYCAKVRGPFSPIAC